MSFELDIDIDIDIDVDMDMDMDMDMDSFGSDLGNSSWLKVSLASSSMFQRL